MGKGDKKTKKGKRFLGSYGVKRKQKTVTAITPAEKPKTPKPAKVKAEAAVEEKTKAVKKEAAEPKPKAPKKEPAEKKEKEAAAPKATAKKKTKEE